MSAKPCVSCHKLMAASFTTCPFCKAEQPAAGAAAPVSVKETRCPTCKRPYSAKLEACPFCAKQTESGRHETPGGGPGSSPGLGSSPSISTHNQTVSAGPADIRKRFVTSGLLFGGPFIAGAIWGIVTSLTSNRLGGEEASGLFVPCLIASFFISPALAAGFVRRVYGTFAEAIDEISLTKVIGIGAIASAVVLVPTALTISGFVESVNALAIDDREREVPCKAISVYHRMSKGTDMGWFVDYTCDVDGEHLIGTHHPPSQPDFADGAEIRFVAARGRFGIWLRRSEPLPPGVVPVK